MCVQLNSWCVVCVCFAEGTVFEERSFICFKLGQGAISVSGECFCCGVYSILLFCRFARCCVTMVVCIVVRLVFKPCSLIMSGFVLTCVVYLLLSVICSPFSDMVGLCGLCVVSGSMFV